MEQSFVFLTLHLLDGQTPERMFNILHGRTLLDLYNTLGGNCTINGMVESTDS